jgi:hypothetical protein
MRSKNQQPPNELVEILRQAALMIKKYDTNLTSEEVLLSPKKPLKLKKELGRHQLQHIKSIINKEFY